MYDPWELLDRTANISEVGGFASGVLYWVYKHRDKLRGRLGISDPHVQELTGGGIESLASMGGGKIHQIHLQAQATGTASMNATVQRRESGYKAIPPSHRSYSGGTGACVLADYLHPEVWQSAPVQYR
jgi:hypothetical protein